MTTFADRKEQVIALLERAIALARKLSTPEVEQNLREALQRLSDEKLLAVVCGEFKRGKSSLLNALLTEQDLLPVDVDIATAVISMIEWGTQEEIQVWTGEGRGKPSTIDRGEVAEYVSAARNRDNWRQARLLRIKLPSKQLKDGLVLVDTPGVGGINLEHSAATMAFVLTADVVLFVADVLSPLTTDELQFLAEKVVPHCQDILFVVSKIDRVASTVVDEIVESDRQKLSKLLGKPAAEISIIPVSSSSKLAYVTSSAEEDLVDSRFPQLEEALWKLLERRRGQLLLGRGLHGLIEEVGRLRTPLQAELEAFRLGAKELDEIEAKLRSAEQRLRELAEHGAEWRGELSRGLQTIRERVLHADFDAGSVQLHGRIETYLGRPDAGQNPSWIFNQASAEINAFASRLFKQILSEGGALHRRIEAMSQIDLDLPHLEVPEINVPQNALGQLASKARSSTMRKALEISGQATLYGSSGGLLGGMIGGILGFTIGLLGGGVGAVPAAALGTYWGTVLGTVAGAATGARAAWTNINQRDYEQQLGELRARVTAFVGESLVLTRSEVEKALLELERLLLQEFLRKFDQQRMTLARTQQAFNEGRQRSRAETERRAAELAVPLRDLEELAVAGQRMLDGLVAEPTR